MKIVALAGGVGGAKLADGLAGCLPPGNLTVIVNTADDFIHFGLHISPDLDTVCYTLAGLANPDTGWGRADESWQVLESLSALQAPGWFRLGDKDLATHLERTRRLAEGQPLSQVTRHLCAVWGVQQAVLPMSDDPVSTWVQTDTGELPFQEYFVLHQCQPEVRGFRFAGVEASRPAPGVLESIACCDAVVICPSNPWVSIAPILAVPGIQEILSRKPVIAVSPIVGGKTLKGPAAKMYAEMGIQPSALAVARHYGGLLKGFIIDRQDASPGGGVSGLDNMDLDTLITDTIMKSRDDRLRLAQNTISFSVRIRSDYG